MSNLLGTVSSIFTQYWLDLLVGTIMVFSIIRGIQRGALRSLFSLFGWGAAIVFAFFAQPITADFIRDYTPVYDVIQNSVQKGLSEEMLGKSSLILTQYLKLPDLLDAAIQKASRTLAYSLSESITVLSINILTFVFLVLCFKLIIYLLNEVARGVGKIAVIKGLDRFFGIFIGAARGAIIVAVIMALLVGVLSITNSNFLSKSITQSRIAKQVYDKNYIFLLVKQVGGHKNTDEGIPREDIENSKLLDINIPLPTDTSE